MAPGWLFLSLPLGVVAGGIALAGVLLPRRRRLWAAAALVLALGVITVSGVRLAPSAITPANVEPIGTLATKESTVQVDPDASVVTYEITTDGLSVTHLSYVDLINGTPTMTEALGVPPPFEHTIVLPADSAVPLSDLSVTGMGGATSRRTTCRLTVDGTTVATSSADGAYGLVTCAIPREAE